MVHLPTFGKFQRISKVDIRKSTTGLVTLPCFISSEKCESSSLGIIIPHFSKPHFSDIHRFPKGQVPYELIWWTRGTLVFCIQIATTWVKSWCQVCSRDPSDPNSGRKAWLHGGFSPGSRRRSSLDIAAAGKNLNLGFGGKHNWLLLWTIWFILVIGEFRKDQKHNWFRHNNEASNLQTGDSSNNTNIRNKKHW